MISISNMKKKTAKDSCESSFKSLVRNGSVKDRNIEGLDAFYMVEILFFIVHVLLVIRNFLIGPTSWVGCCINERKIYSF